MGGGCVDELLKNVTCNNAQLFGEEFKLRAIQQGFVNQFIADVIIFSNRKAACERRCITSDRIASAAQLMDSMQPWPTLRRFQ